MSSSLHRSSSCLLLLSVLAVACGDADEVTCEPGTVLAGDQCGPSAGAAGSSGGGGSTAGSGGAAGSSAGNAGGAGSSAGSGGAGSGGAGGSGQGGAGGALAPTLMLASGYDHSCVGLVAGGVACWGANLFGQLGFGEPATWGDNAGQMGAALPRVDLGAGSTVTGLATGNLFSCALLGDRQVRCWGGNQSGQIGIGSPAERVAVPGMGTPPPAVDLGAGVKVVQIEAGLFHVCALLEGGAVKCWGNNGAAQLGLGDLVDRGQSADQMGDALPAVDLGAGVKATALSVGNFHTCALLEGGKVKCWGVNQWGQLGVGDVKPRGGFPGEMGDALPFVDLGTNAAAVAVAVGETQSCVVLAGGGVKCWGGGGRLGLGDGDSRGDEPGEMGDALPLVDLGAPAVALSIGQAHTCARLEGDRLKCWGGNFSGQLGLGDQTDRGSAPGQMGAALPFVDLGEGARVTTVVAGIEHTCALLEGGRVKCWGGNGKGQLGLGDAAPRGGQPGQMGGALPALDLGAP